MNHRETWLTALVVSNLFFCGQVLAGEKYNELEDAAVAEAKVWQAGGKAHPVMSSDGKVIFPFGQTMPKLTCSPTRACDVEMQPGEKVKKVILGDGANWTWEPAESIETGHTVQHVIFQPRDSDLESNVIITTDHRTYHIKLYAPKKEGAYLNRIAFYYPQELVTEWDDKAAASAVVKAKEEGLNVMSAAVSPEKLDFDYKMEGDASFKPVRVFNNGERVYMEMPDSLNASTYPTLLLLDEKDNVMVVNYRREIDPETKKIHYVVDKLFSKGELIIGTEKVLISWKKKEKSIFDRLGMGS